MDIGFWQQIIANGFVLGLGYVLVASGFTLIFSITRIFNFAHGEIYMLGAFATYYFREVFGYNYALSILLAMILMFVLGILLERVFFRPLRGYLYPPFMMSLGLILIISAGAMHIFGTQLKVISAVVPGVVNILGARISWERLIVIFSCAVIMTALYLFIKYTKVGMALRAIAQNSEAASLMGVSHDQMAALAFGIGSALAAVAGGIMAPLFYVDPHIGGPAVFKALIVVLLGGIGSIPGAVVGGLALGFIESLGLTFIGMPAYIVSWIMVMLVFAFRPMGILGKQMI